MYISTVQHIVLNKIVVHVCLPLSSLDRKCFNDYLLCAK